MKHRHYHRKTWRIVMNAPKHELSDDPLSFRGVLIYQCKCGHELDAPTAALKHRIKLKTQESIRR